MENFPSILILRYKTWKKLRYIFHVYNLILKKVETKRKPLFKTPSSFAWRLRAMVLSHSISLACTEGESELSREDLHRLL
jgi:hypothetical protein